MTERETLEKVPVTKHDAARRQLETGIALWFHDKDPVSIHTLVAAALQITHDIGKKIGKPARRFEADYVKEERRDEYRRLLRAAQNFFKHADRDAADTYFFSAQANKYLLFDAVTQHHDITGEETPIMAAYRIHFTTHHPQYFKDLRDDPSLTEPLRHLSKPRFFAEAVATFSVPIP